MAKAKDLVRKFLDLSTAHLSQELLDMLERSPDACPMSVIPTPYGYLVWVNEDSQDAAAAGVPMEMLIIFRVAARNDCGWVMFDRDGRECDELPLLNPECEFGPDEQAAQVAMRDAHIAALRTYWKNSGDIRESGRRSYTRADPDGLDRDNLGETPEPSDGGDVDHD